MEQQKQLETAVSIAREAGAVLARHFRDVSLNVRAKGERDVVTDADTESETLIRRRLEEFFPEDGVTGEESGETTRGALRRWYVDPLDGTLNFSRGVPVWCVSMALYEGDSGILGVVHDPLRGDTFVAGRRFGAFHNGAPVKTTKCDRLDQAFVHLTVDFNDISRKEGLEDIQRLAPAVLRTRNIGSAALGLAYVAAGWMDAMLHRHANAWDYGAGALLVEEAGGAVSTMQGERWSPGQVSIAAAATDRLRVELLSRVSDRH
jgi:myo-inositol-1(or 4)-monophosphatase